MSQNLFANDQETPLELATDQQPTPRHLDLENSERTQRPDADGRKGQQRLRSRRRAGRAQGTWNRMRSLVPSTFRRGRTQNERSRAPFLTSARRRTNVRTASLNRILFTFSFLTCGCQSLVLFQNQQCAHEHEGSVSSTKLHLLVFP